MTEKTRAVARIFRGRLLGLDVVEVEVAGGGLARREIVRHPGAVAVLAERPDGKFIFVRQFRKPVERTLLEVVAGTKARTETPLGCARRELLEETGYRARRIRKLGRIYLTPGYSDEEVWVYLARVDSNAEVDRRLDDDEHVEIVLLESTDVDLMIRKGRIRDAKTLAAWLLLRASQQAGLPPLRARIRRKCRG